MPIAKESGKDFTPLPAGSHIARCFAVIALGTQNSPMFPASFKVMVMWEVPGESIVIDGKPAPMTIQKEYSNSLSPKSNLRHDLQSWRGREFTVQELEGFAVEKVIGIPAMLSVIHQTTAATKKLYAKVAGVAGLPKGVVCVPAWHKPVHFEIEHGRNDVFNALPHWIKAKIEQCEEWVHPAATPEPEHEPEPPEESDDVPFSTPDATPAKQHHKQKVYWTGNL